ncbi:MAG: alpha/beta fold hydrolase [Pseudomonadota bacterium]
MLNSSRWRFRVIPTAILVFAAVLGCGQVPALSLEDSASVVVPPRIASERTCYTGEWGTEAAYLARPQTQKLYADPSQRERAVRRYQFWRDHFDCRWIRYSVDDLMVDGFIVTPNSTPPEGGWPVIIFNHGGNADIGQVRFQYIAMRLFPLVDAGFMVMGSQYRGTRIGDSPNPDRLRDEYGGADVNDILALLDIATSRPEADSARIGMWGTSRGGMMSLLAARRDSRIDSLVVEATPTDLKMGLQQRPDMARVFSTWIPGFERDPDSALESRSVMYWIDELDPDLPVLIIHGSDDGRVDPVHAKQFATALAERNHPHKLIIYEGDKHGIRKHHREMIREISDWFAPLAVQRTENPSTP